jgi:hypothetical protein
MGIAKLGHHPGDGDFSAGCELIKPTGEIHTHCCATNCPATGEMTVDPYTSVIRLPRGWRYTENHYDGHVILYPKCPKH